MEEILRRNLLMWLGHVHRMENNRLARPAMKGLQRKRGRPRKNWRAIIEDDLNVSWEEAEKSSGDRTMWQGCSVVRCAEGTKRTIRFKVKTFLYFITSSFFSHFIDRIHVFQIYRRPSKYNLYSWNMIIINWELLFLYFTVFTGCSSRLFHSFSHFRYVVYFFHLLLHKDKFGQTIFSFSNNICKTINYSHCSYSSYCIYLF